MNAIQRLVHSWDKRLFITWGAYMRVFIRLLLVGGLVGLASAVPAEQKAQIPQQTIFPSSPLFFTENQGQWPDSVLFRAAADGAVVWIMRTGVCYQYMRAVAGNAASVTPGGAEVPGRRDHEPESVEVMLVKASLVEANPEPEVVAEGLTGYICNYFLGNDPSKWRTGIRNYESVTLRGIYDGVSLKFTGGADGSLRYEYASDPGAAVDRVEVAYEGVEESVVDNAGRVYGQTAWGEVAGLLAAPASMSGEVAEAQAESGTDLGGEFGPGLTGAVDPPAEYAVALGYSTFLGGADPDYGEDLVVDEAGNVYVTGMTYSVDFPAESPYPHHQATFLLDVFVTKLSSTGTGLIYSTYLGGNGHDWARDIALAGDGSVYITGSTYSNTTFPRPNAYDSSFNGGFDAFVARLSNDGSSLLYGTFLGGGDEDYGWSIVADVEGNAYLTGYTKSTDFPLLNAIMDEPQDERNDAIVAKFSASGELVYSTYLGGHREDWGFGIAVDKEGYAYVGGITESVNFPVKGAYQDANHGMYDAFVAKVSQAGDSLVYSTYLGGHWEEYCYDVAVDSEGNAYIGGHTLSDDYPTLNPFQEFQGYYNVIVTKLNPQGNGLVYSTYLGGNSDPINGESCWGMALDRSGSVCVTGYTWRTDFPLQNAYDSTYTGIDPSCCDVFVTKFTPEGNRLVYSTYLGGSSWDQAFGVAFDSSGNAYVTGRTLSADFPVWYPFQEGWRGHSEVFVTKFVYDTVDADADGVVDAVDNCLGLSNPDQADADWDGIGDSCCCTVRGDLDGSGATNVADLTALVNYLFQGAIGGGCPAAWNVNSIWPLNVADLTYTVNFLFKGGPAPGACY